MVADSPRSPPEMGGRWPYAGPVTSAPPPTSPGDEVGSPTLPLAGLTVGITADRRWEEQADSLRRRGASVVHAPTIATVHVDPDGPLRDVTVSLIAEPPQYLVANTGIGMRSWFQAAETMGLAEPLIAALARTKIYARGPKATSAVRSVGLEITAKAESEQLAEVVQLLLRNDVANTRIGFQRHGQVAPAVLEPLRHAGAEVFEVPVYQWVGSAEPGRVLDLIDGIIERRIDGITFTSAPAVRNFVAIAEAGGRLNDLLDALAHDVAVACVGPVCGAAAFAEGMTSLIVPDTWRVTPMIKALTEHLIAVRS
ncbi:MAG: bifunctional uroporphyrinogen-III synthetase/response regulator domain protein [Acidimicrobiia bacterium]|nr:bifunctional uroporphyrinogen-III synthetase/response regulator domain protein [Acidimicrobiia bacterium]